MSDLPCNAHCDNRACHWRSCMGVCTDNEPCDERRVDGEPPPYEPEDEELCDCIKEEGRA